MKPRRTDYLVQYSVTKPEATGLTMEIRSCRIFVTNVEQVHKKMETDYPDAKVDVIYELKQVWEEG